MCANIGLNRSLLTRYELNSKDKWCVIGPTFENQLKILKTWSLLMSLHRRMLFIHVFKGLIRSVCQEFFVIWFFFLLLLLLLFRLRASSLQSVFPVPGKFPLPWEDLTCFLFLVFCFVLFCFFKEPKFDTLFYCHDKSPWSLLDWLWSLIQQTRAL